jgi:hypothetical protein
VEVPEHLRVEKVGLVDEEDRVDALAAEVLDVGGDGVEDAGGGGLGVEAEGEAELAVEVAAAERGVVAVGESVAGLGEALAERAQDAGLAPPVMGPRKRRSATSRASSSPAKRSRSDNGRPPGSAGGMKAAAAARQNALSANASRHHLRHRSTVRRLTPRCSRSLRIRAGVAPCRIAETSTTTAPR